MLLFLCSCQKNFNEHSITPNFLDIKNYIFIQNVFTYGLHNHQENTVILILIPDNHSVPTKYKFITLRKPNKVQAVLNTLTKENVFDNNDFIEIKKWLEIMTHRMKSINMNEISKNEEKKLNLDLENEVINSIVLQYTNSIPQRNAQRISSEVEKINKELDDISPENLRNLKSRGDKLLNELLDDNKIK